jgi:hypothetical protein
MPVEVITEFEVLEPAIDPNSRIGFLLDWELTMKCNLDCSYCPTGIHGGHDNSTQHPSLEKCLDAIDFMFKYVDLYMNTKPRGIRYVILNVYGGESLHHPDIVEILQQVKQRYQPYADLWHLTVTTTTNAIVSPKKLEKILPLIDEFTVSYHSESTEKQKQQFKDNILTIRNSGRRQKCVVMIHNSPEYFQDSVSMIQWLSDNDIKFLPKQLDGDVGTADKKRIYNNNQVKWFDQFYQQKTFETSTDLLSEDKDLRLTDVGRACCGGRQTCQNQNYKQRHFYVENKFPDWYCSVNEFFLFVKQVNGEIYVNKDCKMNFDGNVGPIGLLEHAEKILSNLKFQLENKTLPIIQCKKYKCNCGLCAPKAKHLDVYKSVMKKYQLN